jgi:hypothetical protein
MRFPNGSAIGSDKINEKKRGIEFLPVSFFDGSQELRRYFGYF